MPTLLKVLTIAWYSYMEPELDPHKKVALLASEIKKWAAPGPQYFLKNWELNIQYLHSVEFACALLREVLVALTESSVLREKVILRSFIEQS